jgi:hypothetical protein
LIVGVGKELRLLSQANLTVPEQPEVMPADFAEIQANKAAREQKTNYNIFDFCFWVYLAM